MSQALNICVIGDEFVAGTGDPKGLGWLGRVAARTAAYPPPTFLALAVPQETTANLGERWLTEVERRLRPDCDNRLVFAPGWWDLESGVSLARSRLHLANILDIAIRKRLPAMVVGPTPGPVDLGPRIAALSDAYSDVTTRRGLRYVEVYEPLSTHDQWLTDLAEGDGIHPGQAGYGLITWLVLHNGWYDWLSIDPAE